MRRFWALSFFLLLVSCQYFLSEGERTDQLVEETLAQVDMNSVEQYPLFDGCDETAPKPEQKDCFQNSLMLQLQAALGTMEIRSGIALSDTLWIDLKIDENGYLSVAHIFENDRIETSLPELKEKIAGQLNDSTKIEPALKHGVPVGMKVRLPMVIETTN